MSMIHLQAAVFLVIAGLASCISTPAALLEAGPALQDQSPIQAARSAFLATARKAPFLKASVALTLPLGNVQTRLGPRLAVQRVLVPAGMLVTMPSIPVLSWLSPLLQHSTIDSVTLQQQAGLQASGILNFASQPVAQQSVGSVGLPLPSVSQGTLPAKAQPVTPSDRDGLATVQQPVTITQQPQAVQNIPQAEQALPQAAPAASTVVMPSATSIQTSADRVQPDNAFSDQASQVVSREISGVLAQSPSQTERTSPASQQTPGVLPSPSIVPTAVQNGSTRNATPPELRPAATPFTSKQPIELSNETNPGPAGASSHSSRNASTPVMMPQSDQRKEQQSVSDQILGDTIRIITANTDDMSMVSSQSRALPPQIIAKNTTTAVPQRNASALITSVLNSQGKQNWTSASRGRTQAIHSNGTRSSSFLRSIPTSYAIAGAQMRSADTKDSSQGFKAHTKTSSSEWLGVTASMLVLSIITVSIV